jgi:hypothetical protein
MMRELKMIYMNHGKRYQPNLAQRKRKNHVEADNVVIVQETGQTLVVVIINQMQKTVHPEITEAVVVSEVVVVVVVVVAEVVVVVVCLHEVDVVVGIVKPVDPDNKEQIRLPTQMAQSKNPSLP